MHRRCPAAGEPTPSPSFAGATEGVIANVATSITKSYRLKPCQVVVAPVKIGDNSPPIARAGVKNATASVAAKMDNVISRICRNKGQVIMIQELSKTLAGAPATTIP
jgi:hypothetical protein